MTGRQTIGFFVVCLLSSASWLTASLFPSGVEPIGGAGLRLLLVGGVGVVVHLWLPRANGLGFQRRYATMVGASLGFVGVPFLLLVAAEGKVGATSVVLVFAGMPILLAVSGASEEGLRVLPAGLMGIAGLLILLPLTLPQGGAGVAGLGMVAVSMVCAGGCMVWLHRVMQGLPVAESVGFGGVANGVLCLLVARVSGMTRWDARGLEVECLRGVLIDLPQLFLLFWLVKGVEPRRVAGQYVVAPLLTVVEGLVVLRPRFEVRTVVGVALLGWGAYLMFRRDRMEQDVGLKLG